MGDVSLEGLRERPSGAESRIRIAPAAPGLERAAARLRGRAFAPHRHDIYAIGLTLSGVQTFTYRGARRHGLPGQIHVLHPDETHDGAAGTDEGFGYRIAYVDPALIQAALGGRPLPFVADPVVTAAPQASGLSALWRVEDPLDERECDDLVVALADALAAWAGAAPVPAARLPLAGLNRVRDLIAADPARPLPMERLEREAGLDRWSLARGFRAAFGTSPSGFRTMRRLDRARTLIATGTPLAEAAFAAGFADQSHLSRQFKRAYGVTPARWAALTRAPEE
ncbi:MAG TPA: AraC family transcriptional regulator [Microvirga sp.]|jgi:AraC-like DNA-binding protein|nr:AraC family transcriptional regulator [Microvirga sp.]